MSIIVGNEDIDNLGCLVKNENVFSEIPNFLRNKKNKSYNMILLKKKNLNIYFNQFVIFVLKVSKISN